MPVKNKDFIAIEFSGRVKNGEVFDSNFKEDLEKMHQGHNHPVEAKPFIFSVGSGMFLKGIDEFLVGKEIGKSYNIELNPEKAFGPRNPSFVQTVPMKIFKEQRINPVVGATLNFDGRMGRIITVSSGRVMVDFNHYLAGKQVEYKIKILKEITDINEKIKAINDFFFRRDFEFKLTGKKLVMNVDKPLVQFVDMFKDQFKEMLDLDLEVKGVDSESKSTSPAHDH